MYYLRTKPAANALQFTVDKTKLNKANKTSKDDTHNSSIKNEKVDENLSNPEENDSKKNDVNNTNSTLVCSLENGDACMACGS